MSEQHIQLNPYFFNNREQFVNIGIVKEIERTINSNQKELVLDMNDIDSLYIIGDNIMGRYTNNTPLEIQVYSKAYINQQQFFILSIKRLQTIIRNAYPKYRDDYNLKLIPTFDDPRKYPKYYDLIDDRLVINKDFKTFGMINTIEKEINQTEKGKSVEYIIVEKEKQPEQPQSMYQDIKKKAKNVYKEASNVSESVVTAIFGKFDDKNK